MNLQAKLDAIRTEKGAVAAAGNEASARVQQLHDRMHQLAGAEAVLAEMLADLPRENEQPGERSEKEQVTADERKPQG